MGARSVTFDFLKRTRPLNHPDACKLARELWGEAGAVEMRYDNQPHRRYMVGTKGAAPGKRTLGRGASWEEAFAAAEECGLL